MGPDPQGRSLLGEDHLDTSLVRCPAPHIILPLILLLLLPLQPMVPQVRVVPGARTAAYTALLDSGGECRLGVGRLTSYFAPTPPPQVGDMEIHSEITPDYVLSQQEQLSRAPLVVCDGNLPQETIHQVMQLCHTHQGG